MRAPLEQMERVAAYVAGKMSPEQRVQFESDLMKDPDLLEQLEFQQEMQQVIQRQALRAEIAHAGKQYGGFNGFSLSRILSGVAIIAAGVAAWMFLSPAEKTEQPQPPVVQKEAFVAEQQTDEPAAVSVAPGQTERVATDGQSPRTVVKRRSQLTDPEVEVASELQTMAGHSSAETVQITEHRFDPKQLIPVGFEEKILTLYGIKTPLTADQLQGYYYGTAYTRYKMLAASATQRIYATCWTKSMVRHPMEGYLPRKVRKRYKVRNNAFVEVINANGDHVSGVRMKLNYFGEEKEVVTDSGAVAQFRLHSPIRSEVRLIFPDGREALLEQVTFEPKKLVMIQVEMRSEGVASRQEQVDAAAHTCRYVDPLAVQALNNEAFECTFLSTAGFAERLHVLQGLENGQDLLEIYVHNLNKPITVVDAMVADRLSGSLQQQFSSFAAEKGVTVESVDQMALSALYRQRLEMLRAKAEREAFAVLQQAGKLVGTDERQDAERQLCESVLPCAVGGTAQSTQKR